MKFLLSLSFLLFAAASSINASPPILDATGAPVKFGVPYNMIPFLDGSGGVSLPPPTPSQPCPEVIQLTTPETDRGTPVVFSSAVPDVTIGSELIISFYNLTRPELCGNSTTWTVTRRLKLAVGFDEDTASVFRLLRCWRATIPDSGYFLQLVRPFPNMDFEVGSDESRNLLVLPSQWPFLNLCFRFEKSTQEAEDDKRVIIQMPRKMSV